jgi:N utilization substance protein B
LGKRRKSREIAIQILYQLEVNHTDIETAVQAFWKIYKPSDDLKEFLTQILNGVIEHRAEIDQILSKTSDHWSLHRMDLVDRSILREAIFEMLYCPDIPAKVTIDEAVELAKLFGTHQSSSFINGILDNIAHQCTDKKPITQQ